MKSQVIFTHIILGIVLPTWKEILNYIIFAFNVVASYPGSSLGFYAGEEPVYKATNVIGL